MQRRMVEINERAGRTELGLVPGKMQGWPDSVRAIPNAILRSSLFGAIAPGDRLYVERQVVATWGKVTIRYTGAQLDQSDLSVWMATLHIARHHPTAKGHACSASAYKLLQLLGRTDSGKNRDILQRQLSRLSATSLEISFDAVAYEGSLIEEVYRDDETRAYVIQLNPRLHTLFQQDMTTWVNWGIRNQLTKQPLAQWLHSFYSTHKHPFDVKVETLHRMCGSEAVCMRGFTKSLRKALNAVSAATELHGAIFKWEINAGLLSVRRRQAPHQYNASHGVMK